MFSLLNILDCVIENTLQQREVLDSHLPTQKN